MITRKISRPKKEPRVGINLRLSEVEFGFLHEVKAKRGCTIAAYIRFLLHRSTYENNFVRNDDTDEKIMLLMNQELLTENYRMMFTESEHSELVRIKKDYGIPYNTYIRWLLRRRMYEYMHNNAELLEVV